MISRRPINISGLYAASLALFLVFFTLNSSAKSIAGTIFFGHIASGIMALPPRAYAERQQLSPIRVDGVIQEVTCENNRCRVKLLIESVKRNTSSWPLAKGNVIAIIDIPAQDSKADSMSPIEHQAPMIGLPDNSVHIPPPCSRIEAWLRPAEPSGDRNHSNTYQLMAGPYGFGPSLED